MGLDDKYEVAIEFLNKMLPAIPSYEGFQFHSIITDSDLSSNDKETAFTVISEMETILKKEDFLDNGNYYGNLVLQLNTKGRELKKQGSFEQYQQYLEERNKPNPTIINKMRDNYGLAIQSSELRNSPVIHKATTTPKINERNAINSTSWYWSKPFKYIIWPLVVLLIGTYILHLIKII